MARLLLIGNPTASSVTARARVVIAKALAADHDVTVASTSRRGHATRLAQGAAAEGTEVVVSLGGDGTVNEVANGLAGSDTVLGVLPGGSTNVFARTIGMVNDPIEATGELLSALAAGSIQRIGLGSVNDRYFLFHVGMGLDAEVVRLVERRGQLKRWAGHPLFAWCGLRAWSGTYDRSRPRFAVRHPDGTVVDDALFGLCQNSNPYTYLGNRPLETNPNASLDRPLSMLSFRDLDLLPTLCYLTSAFLGGDRLVRDPRVVERHDLERLTVTGHGPFPYQVDGDHLGDAERLELAWVPDVLTLAVPAPADPSA
ncbi:MAG: diacylglycerol kinase family protein [Acidimicrobiales bacterium]